MEAAIKEDGFLQSASCEGDSGPGKLLCLWRIKQLRTQTDLLPSVALVEESFSAASAALERAQQIACALQTACRQHKAAQQALEKARRLELEAQQREKVRLEKQAEREKQKEARLAAAAAAGAGGEKKRRAPSGAVPCEDDPPVLASKFPEGCAVCVVETYAA